MKKKRAAFLSLCVLAVGAAAFSLHAAGVIGGPPALKLPQHGVQMDYEVSEDLEFPREEKAPLYKMEAVPEELQREAERVAESLYPGGAGDPWVETESARGYWSVKENGDSLDALKAPENLPAEEEAARIGKDYLTEQGLFQGEFGKPEFGYSSTGSGTAERILRRHVTFSPVADGKPVYGMARLSVTVGENGAVTGVTKQGGVLKEAGSVALKSKEEALREVREHPEKLSCSECYLETGRITECELAYYADGSSYVHPIYVFSGQGTSLSQEDPVEFTLIADAAE